MLRRKRHETDVVYFSGFWLGFEGGKLRELKEKKINKTKIKYSIKCEGDVLSLVFAWLCLHMRLFLGEQMRL